MTKPAHEKLKRSVAFRITDAEMADLIRVAGKEGPTQWARRMVRAAVRRVRK